MARTPVRSYVKKDGTRVRAHSRSVRAGGATVVVTVTLGAFVVARPPVGRPTPRPNAAQVKVTIDATNARASQAMLRLRVKGYRVNSRARFDGSDCAGHAYGDVRAFFRDRHCLGLGRAAFEVTDRRRNVVLVAVSSVAMPDPAAAGAYQGLVDRHGTGNITELSRDQGRYRSVRFIGFPYASRRDGVVVTNVQVQPVGRGPGPKMLELLKATALS